MPRFALCCVMAFIMTSQVACDPFSSPDSMMDEYLSRLARVLDVEANHTAVESVMLMPRTRDRRVEVPELDINMLDFFSLYGCGLQVVVGERNSSMGRLMTPLNHLRYDIRFIAAAQQCLPEIHNLKLKKRLHQAIEQKQQRLSLTSWNAIWAGEAMAELLSLSKGYFTIEDETNAELGQLVAGLELTRDTIKQLLNTKQKVDLEPLGEVQQRWTFGHQAGQLLNSAKRLTHRLDEATVLMEKRLQKKPLCYLSKPNQQAKRVEGVFFRVYIARIQPYISAVSRAGKQVFDLLDDLATLQSNAMPASFMQYYQQVIDRSNTEGIWRQFEQAVKRHTKSWQALLKQCGMQPKVD